MLCDFAPHSETHVRCTRCQGLFPHGGHAPDRVRRTCPGEGQARKSPSLLTRAANGGKALVRNAANGFRRAPADVRAQRKKVCESNVCGKFGKGWCELCGCHLQTKQAMAAESCPDNPSRWPAWTPDRKPGPVRVAFLTPSLGQGGAERWIVDLCRNLPAFDVDVRSAWLIDGGQSWQPVIDELVSLDVAVFGGPNLMPGRPNAVYGITRIGPHLASLTAALQDVDIAITWGLPGIQDLMRGTEFPGRVVVVAHCEGDPTAQMLRRSIEGVSHFAAVSHAAAKEFPREIRPRVKVIYNGCHTGRVQPIQGRAAQRCLWGIEDDEIAIGFLGRLHHDKRPLAIVDAAEAMGPKAKAVLIGEGLHQVEILREARQRLGDRLIAPGPMSPIGDALAALDVWMLASPSEGFTIAMVEAWAAGVPVIATPLNFLRVLEVEYGPMTTEIPFAPSPHDLVAAVRHALSPSGRSIRDLARETTLEHLTAELSAQRWAEWLREICPVAV